MILVVLIIARARLRQTPAERKRVWLSSHECQSYTILMDEAAKALMTRTGTGHITGVQKLNEAGKLADQFGGEEGAEFRSNADHQLCRALLLRMNDMPAAARAACSSLRAARVSGSRSTLVRALSMFGDAATKAPSEMVKAERESREQERLSGSPCHAGLDLSQEGRDSLPSTAAALSRLGLAYHEAAVAICVSALAAVGGHSGPGDDDERRVPVVAAEARARGYLGYCLWNMNEERHRSLELCRQAVALWRRVVKWWTPLGTETLLIAQCELADELSALAAVLEAHGSAGRTEAEACLREALALCEDQEEVGMIVKTLRNLINFGGEAHTTVGLAEAEAFRSRLNQLLVQTGRTPETVCSICFEPLAPSADGAAEGAADGGSSGGVGVHLSACVHVLHCDHQFHHGCIMNWRRTTTSRACPICKRVTR